MSGPTVSLTRTSPTLARLVARLVPLIAGQPHRLDMYSGSVTGQGQLVLREEELIR